MALLGDGNDLRIALQLDRESSSSQFGQPVIAASLIGMRRIRFLARLLNQSISQHALKRTIERAGSHFDLTLAILFDLLHDLIPMLLSTGECEQDIEHRWR